MKYFVAIYTNKVKKYCDQQFFRNLGKATKDKNCFIHIVDNSFDMAYTRRLANNMLDWLGHKKYDLEHVSVEYSPRETLFLRNVCNSVSHLRKKFLKSTDKYFIIFETDVIMPENILELFSEVEEEADIIGGLYYRGWHNNLLFDPCATDLIETKHVLSGCTLYNRKVIKKIPFRWDNKERAEFPDSLISRDAHAAEFKLVDYAKIKCEHLEDEHRPGRGREAL